MICDAHSRHSVRSQHVGKIDGEQMQTLFASAFRKFGVPQSMRTDTGPPFSWPPEAGLSRQSL